MLPGIMLLRRTVLNRNAPMMPKDAANGSPNQAFQADRPQTSFEDDDRDADYEANQQVRDWLQSKRMKHKAGSREQQYKDDTYKY